MKRARMLRSKASTSDNLISRISSLLHARGAVPCCSRRIPGLARQPRLRSAGLPWRLPTLSHHRPMGLLARLRPFPRWSGGAAAAPPPPRPLAAMGVERGRMRRGGGDRPALLLPAALDVQHAGRGNSRPAVADAAPHQLNNRAKTIREDVRRSEPRVCAHPTRMRAYARA